MLVWTAFCLALALFLPPSPLPFFLRHGLCSPGCPWVCSAAKAGLNSSSFCLCSSSENYSFLILPKSGGLYSLGSSAASTGWDHAVGSLEKWRPSLPPLLPPVMPGTVHPRHATCPSASSGRAVYFWHQHVDIQASFGWVSILHMMEVGCHVTSVPPPPPQDAVLKLHLQDASPRIL